MTFREADAFCIGGELFAKVSCDCSQPRLIIDGTFDYDDAIALRDWLNRVLDSYPVKPKEPFFDPQVNPYAALAAQEKP